MQARQPQLAGQRLDLGAELEAEGGGGRRVLDQAGLQVKVERPQVAGLAVGGLAQRRQDIAFFFEQVGHQHQALDIQVFLAGQRPQDGFIIQLVDQVGAQADELFQRLVNGLLGLLVLPGLFEAGNVDQRRHGLVDHAHDVVFGQHGVILPFLALPKRGAKRVMGTRMVFMRAASPLRVAVNDCYLRGVWAW